MVVRVEIRDDLQVPRGRHLAADMHRPDVARHGLPGRVAGSQLRLPAVDDRVHSPHRCVGILCDGVLISRSMRRCVDLLCGGAIDLSQTGKVIP